MFMELSTGTIFPITSENGQSKYGIENLQRIIRAAINVGKIIGTLRDNPPQKGFWSKVKSFFGVVSKHTATFAELGQDLAQLAVNADKIKDELLDLSADEINRLVTLTNTYGVKITQQKLLETLPVLLSSIKLFLDLR